ncbi:MAG: methyltransferase [Deltaproteobacteria bacterium]|nr:methyltransferase [Deltaproteobacteria bacterium]
MITDRLARSLDLLDEAADILRERVTSPEVPDWCAKRGWAPFLLGLDDQELEQAEHLGLGTVVGARGDAPTSLRAFIAETQALGEAFGPPPAPVEAVRKRRTSKRKSAQVHALAKLAAEVFSQPTRIVDVGAGHGHLTRALADALGAPAVGLDRDASRVETARTWKDRTTTFERWDGRVTPLHFNAGELAVGLHACGDLGDLLVKRAAEAKADVLLVSCCLQKVDGEARLPLSTLGKERGFVVPRALLGLANLSTRAVGVEQSTASIMKGRRTRHALRLLLEARGVPCPAGDESRGINRRRMGHGLAAVAGQALSDRGLGAPTPSETEAVDAQADHEFPRIRRLSLPRAPLGRVLERAIVFDRAAALIEAGHETRIVVAWDADESPRNLAILGRAAP